MSGENKFVGWLGLDKDCYKGNMKWQEYEPKPWDAENDVEIKITHCGICGSDLHTLRSGWGESNYPVCVGHEIVGEAVRVGSKVKHAKVGDRVGVGAQSGSCLKPDCEECMDGLENYCQNNAVQTYNGKFPDGSKSYGGYADFWRGPAHFVFKIPDQIPSESAAPMLCGGITAFSPLKQNGAGPGKKVGIVGLGGLGHYGVLGAVALGCDEIYVISRTRSKEADARKMGATGYIATEEDEDWATKHASKLDLIVSTVSSPKMPLEQYLMLLKTRGQFIQVGAPEDSIPGFNAFSLIAKGVKIGGSAIGSPAEIREMLDIFAKSGVKTWNQNYSMKDANKAIVDMDEGKARYRIVLCNEGHSAKL